MHSFRNQVYKCIDSFFSPLKDSKMALKKIVDIFSGEIENIYSLIKSDTLKVKVYRENKEISLPTKANDTDAGWDIYLPQNIYLKPGDWSLVNLGIICGAPEGYHFKLLLRSSAAVKRGLRQLNAVGIVDSGYTGPSDYWKIPIKNDTDKELKLKAGERIAQMLLEKNEDFFLEEQSDKNFAGESRNGFGSTGE
jgi:dUTP pyrophosphatase